MGRKRVALTAMSGFTLLSQATMGAQDQEVTKPTIDIVSSVGCATQDGATWTLTRAPKPVVADEPFSSSAEIEEAKSISSAPPP